MILFTLISRLVDALPLASSVEDSSSSSDEHTAEYRRQAKQLVKVGFTPFAIHPLPNQATIMSSDGGAHFQYVWSYSP